MHSQLNYIIAQQHHAELIRNAQRRQRISAATTRHSTGDTRAALTSIGARIAAAILHRTPSPARDAS